mmetsp:Transcript_18919/g.58831  ORF Transcript_18919/g.58831 Transcript_18919/m.58831 type:complete len:349 (-) Transcript_18919:82-1128(-)
MGAGATHRARGRAPRAHELGAHSVGPLRPLLPAQCHRPGLAADGLRQGAVRQHQARGAPTQGLRGGFPVRAAVHHHRGPAAYPRAHAQPARHRGAGQPLPRCRPGGADGLPHARRRSRHWVQRLQAVTREDFRAHNQHTVRVPEILRQFEQQRPAHPARGAQAQPTLHAGADEIAGLGRLRCQAGRAQRMARPRAHCRRGQGGAHGLPLHVRATNRWARRRGLRRRPRRGAAGAEHALLGAHVAHRRLPGGGRRKCVPVGGRAGRPRDGQRHPGLTATTGRPRQLQPAAAGRPLERSGQPRSERSAAAALLVPAASAGAPRRRAGAQRVRHAGGRPQRSGHELRGEPV